MSNSSSRLIVRWKPPSQPNGNLSYYLVLWQQLAEDSELFGNDYCHKGEDRRPSGPREPLWPPAHGLPVSPLVCPGLRLPTSSADTRFDTRDSEEREDTAEQQCCPCHSPVGQSQPNVETVSFQKKFENFLHNSIILPRWVTLDGGGPAGGGGAKKGGREPPAPLCPTLSPDPLGKSPPSTRLLITGELLTDGAHLGLHWKGVCFSGAPIEMFPEVCFGVKQWGCPLTLLSWLRQDPQEAQRHLFRDRGEPGLCQRLLACPGEPQRRSRGPRG